jgi:hypothetical protein
MAFPVHTVNIQQAHQLARTVFGPPPAGFVWVLIALDAYYSGLTATTVYLQGTAGQAIWSNNFEPDLAGQYASWRGRAVIGPGQTCAVRVDVGIDITLTAYQLGLP